MDTEAPISPNPDETPRKLGKKQSILFVSLGVAGLLAIIAMGIYVMFFSISKQDYRHASVQTNAVIAAYNQLSKATSTVSYGASNKSVSDEQFQQSNDDYHRAYDTYRVEVNELADEPVLRNGKVQAAYQSFMQKHSDFTRSLDNTMAAAPAVRKATMACSTGAANDVDTSNLATIVNAYDAVVAPCKQAMEALGELESESARVAGAKGVAFIAKVRDQLAVMQSAYTAGNRTAFEAQYNTYLELAADFAAQTDTTRVLQQQLIVTPEKELNNLAAIIKARQ